MGRRLAGPICSLATYGEKNTGRAKNAGKIMVFMRFLGFGAKNLAVKECEFWVSTGANRENGEGSSLTTDHLKAEFRKQSGKLRISVGGEWDCE